MVSIKKIPDPLQAKAIELINRIRRDTGLTVTEIARLAGLSPSTLTRAYPFPRVDYTLSARSLAKLRAKFPVTHEGDPPSEAPAKASRVRRASFAQESLQIFGLEHLKLPVDAQALLMRTWMGDGEGRVEFWSDLQAHGPTAMPFTIGTETDDRLFGVHVAGDLMEPRLKAGEIAVIDRVKPVPLMSDVFLRVSIQDRNVVIIIAQIIKRDAMTMYFSTPSLAKMFAISRDNILEIFPIIAIITNSY